MKDIASTLEKLSKAFGPSGYEDEVIGVLKEMLKDTCEIKVLRNNSLLAMLRGNGKNKILISAHIDEIGLMISKVEGEYARVVPIGGVDPKILPSQRVKIKTSKGFEYAVVGMLAPHLQRGKKKDVSFDSLFLDLSCAPDAKVGDVAVIDSSPSQIDEEHFGGKAMDDRASVACVVESLKTLSNVKRHADVYALFSSREEVGGIGALTGTFEIKPDIAIAVDVTFGDNDAQNAPEIKVGKGPALSIGPATYQRIYDAMREMADREGIEYQIEPIPGRTGTDADAIQLAYKGVPVMVVSIPELYMHTPTEIVSLRDVRSAARLLSAFVIKWGEKNVS